MKKLILTAVFALGTLTAINAQETEVPTQEPTTEEATQNDAQLIAKVEVADQTFKQIKVAELPAPVAKAVATDFEGATVTKAYTNDKGEYKLVVATEVEGKKVDKTLYANSKGEWIKKAKLEAKMKQ